MKENFDIVRFSQVIKSVRKSCGSVLETAAKRSGITKEEAGMLLLFFNNPECRLLTDAACLEGISCTYAAEILHGLIKMGMVETRGAEPSEIKVSVTGKGGIIAKSLNSMLARHLEHLLSGITPEEEAVFKRILDTVYRNALKI